MNVPQRTKKQQQAAPTLNRRQFLRDSALLTGALAAGSLLPGCAPVTAPAAQAPAVVKAGPKGQIIYGQAEPPTSAQWDDQTVFGLVDFQVASLVQNSLWEADETGKLQPRLATDWKWVDEKTLEVNLRQGVKYHDGEGFSAEDVKATLDRVSADTKLAHNLFWAPVTTEIISDYQVRISAEPPFGPLVPVLASTSMLPKAWVADPEKFKSGNIGSGPYRFVSYENNRVTLEANEAYWDGAPGIKTIIFDYIEDPNARLNALLAGDVDIITRCSYEQVQAVDGNAGFYVVENSPAISVAYIHTREKNPAMKNKKFRQALWHAIDRKAILEQLMFGLGIHANSIIPTTALFYEPLKEAYAFDPDKAKKLLDESGVGSAKMSMATANLVPHQKEIDQAVVQWLSDVGIEVELTALEVGQFRTDWPQYDTSLNTIGTPNGDPDFILNFYAGSGVLGVANDADGNGQELVELFKAQRAITDPDQRKPAVTAACEWLWDYQPTGVVSDELWPFVVNARVKDYKRNRTFGETLARYAMVEG